MIGKAIVILLLSVAGCAPRVPVGLPMYESPAPPAGLPPGDRVAADLAARRALMHLHFFTGGRGMHLAPGFLDFYAATAWTGLPGKLLEDRWGINMAGGEVIGVQHVPYKDTTVGVAGCAICHSGYAAGRFIPGLGNKIMDVTRMGADLARLQGTYAAVVPFAGEKAAVAADAVVFANLLANRSSGNLTRGMVPVSFIHGWFYRQTGGGSAPTRAAVKVPALWGYGAKRPAGLFCDGHGVGHPPGWAVAVELTAGQTPDAVRAYLPAVERAEHALANLLPPRYPFPVDPGLASAGQSVFEAECSGCHGDYAIAEDGLPVFQKPRWIPLHRVGTDSDRVDSNTPEFEQRVRASPLADFIRVNPNHRRGYFAPRLDGIWARFPYLHNASVPNVRSLLTPPTRRPPWFSLEDAGSGRRFDPSALGLATPSGGELVRLERAGANGHRDIYDTRRPGHSNAGHDFGTTLDEPAKRALLEYLKTL